MSINMSKTRKALFIFTIMLSTVFLSSDFILSPTIDGLYKAFPESGAAVNFIVSGASILSLFFAPLVSKIMTKCGTKLIYNIGSAVIAASCLLFGLIMNPIWMCAMRILYTIGYECVMIGSVAILRQAYTDEKKLGNIMGFYYAAMGLIGMLIGLFAAAIASKEVFHAYRAYWIMVPIVAMNIFFIPKIKETADEESAGESGKHKSGRMGGIYWFKLVCYMLFYLAYNVPYYLVSVYTAENGMGVMAVGWLNTASTIAGTVAAAIFGVVFGKLRKSTLFVSYALTAISLLLMFLFPTTVMACIAFFLLGAGYMTGYTYAFTYLPGLVPESRMNDGIAYIGVAGGIASFGATYMMTAIMKLTGWSMTKTMIVPAIICGAVAVLELIIGRKHTPGADSAAAEAAQ